MRRHLSPFQIIIAGFAATVFLGALILMLPISSASGEITPFFNALFTSASAVCVTGLITYDTATYWSTFGQFIIMLLIQVGGLGVVTVTVAYFMITGKKIGLAQRNTAMEAISAHQIGGIVKLTGFILKSTFLIEVIGALLFSTVFIKDFGLKGIWYSIFHSVSAFCNAGFDLMGVMSPFSSLTGYSSNYIVNITAMLLIVTGGLGVLVWSDIKTNKHKLKKYSLQSKVVLCTTLFLITVPAIYFYFGEFSDLSFSDRTLNSFFQSVTTRTAGFNTYDLTKLSSAGQVLMIILMLIGGSPGSTAGGMKTTTIAVLLFSAISVFRKKEDVECFGRRISESTIKNAAAILLMYIVLFMLSALVINKIEGIPLSVCFFETASAIGTVGLTLGITPSLSAASKLILIVLMFFGRVGGLTVIFAAFSGTNNKLSKKPQGKITVG